MNRKLPVIALLLLLAACEGYKAPSLSGDASSMSADTLCYRQAYAKNNPAIQAEIAARNLDCEDILRTQRPLGEERF